MATVATTIRDVKRQQAALDQMTHSVASAFFDHVQGLQTSIQTLSRAALYERQLRVEAMRNVSLALENPAVRQLLTEAATKRADIAERPDTVVYATTSAEELTEFGWTSRYREALSQSELTPEEKNALIASMIFAVMVCLFMASQRYSEFADRVQLVDSLTGIGLLLYALLNRSE